MTPAASAKPAAAEDQAGRPDDGAAEPGAVNAPAAPEKKAGAFGSLRDKAKGKLGGALKAGASAAANKAASGVAHGVGHLGGDVVADAMGGGIVGNLAGNLADRGISKATHKGTQKVADKVANKVNGPQPDATGAAPAPAGLPPMPAMTAPPDDSFAPAMAAAAPPATPSEPEAASGGGASEEPAAAGLDWCGWDSIDPEEFWYRVKVIEAAGIKHGDDAYEAKQREFGFRDHGHFQDVKDAYSARHGDDQNAFAQAGINATMRLSKEQMKAAKPAYADVNGIDIKTYGLISGRRGRLNPNNEETRGALFGEYGLNEATYAEVDTTWQARMKEAMTADPMAGGALMTEWSQGFAQSSTGQFGDAARAGAAQAGVDGVAGEAPASAEPCSFERFVEIEQAQAAWSQQGQDIGAKLLEVFNITIMDWSDLGAFWSQKIISDINYVGRYNAVQAQMFAKYGGVRAA